MKDVAEILKLLMEKSNLLAAGGLVAAGLFFVRWLDYAANANGDFVFVIYIVGGFCAAILVTGGVKAVFDKWQAKRKQANKREEIRKKALENMASLPDVYQRALVWMYVFDRRRVSEEGSTNILDTLFEQGYLDKDFPDEYHSIKTYTVRNEIWEFLQKLNKDEVRSNFDMHTPPWRELRHRI